MVVESTSLDGRHQRRVANRAAVLEAMVELWRDGRFDARAAEIAARAGLSPRSLFRYFDDVDDLVRAAIEHTLSLAAGHGQIAAKAADTTEVKVRALLGARDELYSVVGVAARAARVTQGRSAIIAEHILRRRRQMRDQLRRLFAHELRHAPEGTLEVLDITTSFESWELRQDLSPHARRHADEVLAKTLTNLLQKERR